MTTNDPQRKVIEVDTMTGAERYLANMAADPWLGTFTREEAEASVEWRKANITGRYRYRIVDVQPYMTDNDACRARHGERHGRWAMEECGDVDCMEASRRLFVAGLQGKEAK